ncbi:MAG: HAMP domain-containing sensor histidine kinase, partial [Pseudomonadota bacterium]
VLQYAEATRGSAPTEVEAEDILIMAQRIIGPSHAQQIFSDEAKRQGKSGFLPDVTPDFLERIERELSGSVGAATAHAMIAQIAGDTRVSVEDLMRVADEAQQIIEHSSQLEQKSAELEQSARQLRDVNEQLVALSVQKDAFLSQISHELRTPMTSIRAFSEILMAAEAMQGQERQRYATIIQDESKRLTRLLDDLLDLSVLENGQVELNPEEATLGAVLDRAALAVEGGEASKRLSIAREAAKETVMLQTDVDRLSQVFINLLTNCEKYCDADTPVLRIEPRVSDEILTVDFIDNGSGIPRQSQSIIFEKFARLSDQSKAGGAGLGLAICREIMRRLGGDIAYLPGQGGAAFRVTIPMRQRAAA